MAYHCQCTKHAGKPACNEDRCPAMGWGKGSAQGEPSSPAHLARQHPAINCMGAGHSLDVVGASQANGKPTCKARPLCHHQQRFPRLRHCHAGLVHKVKLSPLDGPPMEAAFQHRSALQADLQKLALPAMVAGSVFRVNAPLTTPDESARGDAGNACDLPYLRNASLAPGFRRSKHAVDQRAQGLEHASRLEFYRAY